MARLHDAVEVYAALAERSAGEDPMTLGIRAIESPVKVLGVPIAHALDTDGSPSLLVPIDSFTISLRDYETKGVSLAERILQRRGRQQRYLSIRCEERTLERQFALLADDLVRALGEDGGHPVDACVDVLERWRSLLFGGTGRLLEVGQLAGLLQELHLVEQLCEHSVSDAEAYWDSTRHSRHDFRSDHAAVEVKATLHREQFLIEIHGLHQLEPESTSKLYLLAAQFEQVNVGGDSVPEAIIRVQRRGFSLPRLEQSLSIRGYSHEHAETYSNVRFAELNSRLMVVGDGMPRVVPDAFRDPEVARRLSGVRYSFDANAVPSIAGSPLRVATDVLSGRQGWVEVDADALVQ